MKELKMAKTTEAKTKIEELKMAKTTAPFRMKMSHKNEFFPKSIFFNAPSTEESKDFTQLKATDVFYAIFEREASGETLDAAEDLLNIIGEQCSKEIYKGWLVKFFINFFLFFS